MLVVNIVNMTFLTVWHNIFYSKQQNLELHSGFFSFVVYIAPNRAKLVYPISSSAKGVHEDFSDEALKSDRFILRLVRKY